LLQINKKIKHSSDPEKITHDSDHYPTTMIKSFDLKHNPSKNTSSFVRFLIQIKTVNIHHQANKTMIHPRFTIY